MDLLIIKQDEDIEFMDRNNDKSRKLSKLPDNSIYEKVIIEDFTSAADLEKQIAAIIANNIQFKNLVVMNSEFGGNVCCDALIKLIHKTPTIRTITIDDEEDCMSDSDRVRLSQYARKILFTFPDGNSPSYISRDDSSLKNKSFSYFYSSADKKNVATIQRKLLRDFFSVYHQQRTGYTCGPAAMLLILDFYNNLHSGMQRNPIIKIDDAFKEAVFEKKLAELAKTTEAEGTAVDEMVIGLKNSGIPAMQGRATNKQSTDDLLGLFQSLLNQGIPILVNNTINIGTEDEEGHYCVITAIEKDKVVIADPGSRYEKIVKHNVISKEDFKNSWVDSKGVIGRYIVIFPNHELKDMMQSQFGCGDKVSLKK